MSGVCGIAGSASGDAGQGAVARMLDAMRLRGTDRRQVVQRDGAVLGAAGHAWELHDVPAASGIPLVADEGDVVVVADAALYYRDELRRRIEARGVHVGGGSVAQLIVAAYRAWGVRCAEWLEGDFAFLLWDRTARRICAARDFAGKRPLFYMQSGESLAVASTIGGILARPGCAREVNLVALAEVASGLFAASHDTSYVGVHALPAGRTLEWTREGGVRLMAHWQLPLGSDQPALSFDDAADALGELLQAAVVERMAREGEGDTAVWLSGGWDSTAVFGMGQQALRGAGGSRRLLPVSMSYPLGDPGREDELIGEAAAFWKAPVHWVDIADAPFFVDPVERAAGRDEPFGHPFESWHRALARGTRSVGARVALEGVGGDQLFQVSDVFMADLLRTGRWTELAREWRGGRMSGAGGRAFFRWAVQPLLPKPALAAATMLRGGRPLHGYLERRLVPWIEQSFAKRHALQERERDFTPARRGSSRSAYEMEWYLTHPFFARIFASASTVSLEEGVEIRSPLLDQRIVRFAAGRPRAERASGRETKRLLRHAVRDVLPTGLLAPRAARTGVMHAYFGRSMQAALPALLEDVLKAPLLAEAGIIDPAALRRSGDAFLAGTVGGDIGGPLYFTLMAEWWLRAQAARGGERPGAARVGLVCC